MPRSSQRGVGLAGCLVLVVPLAAEDRPPTDPADLEFFEKKVRAVLEEKGLAPAPPADPRTLIRRLSFDLTGLPPTPEEVEEFAREHAAGPQAAVEKLVDRLLASPHFGERSRIEWYAHIENLVGPLYLEHRLVLV